MIEIKCRRSKIGTGEGVKYGTAGGLPLSGEHARPPADGVLQNRIPETAAILLSNVTAIHVIKALKIIKETRSRPAGLLASGRAGSGRPASRGLRAPRTNVPSPVSLTGESAVSETPVTHGPRPRRNAGCPGILGQTFQCKRKRVPV